MRFRVLLVVPTLLLATVAALGPDADANAVTGADVNAVTGADAKAVTSVLPVSQPAQVGNSPAVRLTWSACVDRPNALRAGAGIGPLVVDPRMAAAALAHSEDQAQRQTMSHVGSDGSDAGRRLEAAGYRWFSWGENVSAGQTGCGSAIDSWLGSASHRANILNATFTSMGIGMAVGANGVPYWTMDLAVGV